MDAWETLQRQITNCLATVQRVISEAPDSVGAADAVRDYLQEAVLKCREVRKKPLDGVWTPTTNGHDGATAVAAQVDRLVARMEETGTVSGPDPAPVHPFVPPHLAAMYALNQQTGED